MEYHQVSGLCFEVPPISRAKIRQLARKIRQMHGITEPYFPIIQFMEGYHQTEKTFVYDIIEREVMGNNQGITFPDRKLMLIREDIYDGAVEGIGRDRLTIAHEFGHLLMHNRPVMARQSFRDGAYLRAAFSCLGTPRKSANPETPAFCNSEWQANCFGGELLMSADHIHLCKDAWDAMLLFGVSLEAADYQWRKLEIDRGCR
jgi:Zn-dependent peptidase ImmA (M78 family)